MQCLCSLQPYSKKQLRAEDVMRFPWDGSEERRLKSSLSEEGRVKSEEFSCSSGQRELSREEVMARYREAKRKLGLV